MCSKLKISSNGNLTSPEGRLIAKKKVEAAFLQFCHRKRKKQLTSILQSMAILQLQEFAASHIAMNRSDESQMRLVKKTLLPVSYQEVIRCLIAELG
jgi:hypothetical protein